MNKICTLLLANIAIAGCDNSQSDNGPLDASAPTPGITHKVCTFSPDDDDSLEVGVGIDTAEIPILIESSAQAAEDIDLSSLPDDEQFEAVFAVMPLMVPTFADSFAALSSMLNCSREQYDLHRCNWDMSDSLFFDFPMRVQTTFSPPKGFSSTIQSKESGDWETILVSDGVLDDIANGKQVFYDNGQPDVTRTFSRTQNGTETVTYASEKTNWTATENANCSGNMTFSDVKDDKTITFKAEWSFSGSKTSGKLEYVDSSWEDGPFTLNW